jgi:uncharacterized SAM-binding protein YcdF (DUF218 family)
MDCTPMSTMEMALDGSRWTSDRGGAHVLKRLLRGRTSSSTRWLGSAGGAACAAVSGSGRFRTALRLFCSGLAGLGLLVVLVTVTPLVSWWAGVLAGPWEDPNGDVLIVLGGSLLRDGVMGPSSYWRSTYAVLAWGEGTFHRVVVSGGGSAGNSIAEPMRDFLECRGVPRTAIQIENRSRSTHENAVYVTELLARLPGRKVLLTSDYHMFRAHRAFKKAGLEVLPRPFPDARKRASDWTGRWPAFLDLVEETLKIGYYFARGWI